MAISVQQLDKYFGDFHALDNINLEIPTGKLIALLGPSGCGKTTLLRIIAGLEQADKGKIYFDEEEISNIAIRARNIGFMFQHYALFKHMSVFDNIAFGLRVLPRRRRPSKQDINKRVDELLNLVQLQWLGNAYPNQLSGGQRQRVALARALAVSPRLLLLDEPFGALDAKVRKELRLWLKQIHHELNITTIMVTHDQEEALEIADEIVLMNNGKIEQIGTGVNLYAQPKNAFVTEFLGEVNTFDYAMVEDGYLRIGNYQQPIGRADLNQHEEQVVAYVRPHEMVLSRQAHNTINCAKIINIQAVGGMARIFLAMPKHPKPIEVNIPIADFQQQLFAVGEKVYIQPQNTTVFRLGEVIDYVI